MNKRVIGALIALNIISVHARIIVQGDQDAASNESFSFNIFPSVGSQGNFFVGRSDATDAVSDDSIRQYSLSGCAIGNNTFIPLAPAKVKLNGVTDQANPLIGQKISVLETLSGAPLVVTADDPGALYWISSQLGSSAVSVVSTPTVNDAQGIPTTGIISLTAGGVIAFAAVKKSGGSFGQVGSGVAVLNVSGAGISQYAAIPNNNDIKAVPLDGTQSFLTIGSSEILDDSIIDMWWDAPLHRLYIVFKATGGSNASDGAVGIAMGYVNNQTTYTSSGQSVSGFRLYLTGIVDQGLFSSTNTIIGGKGSNAVCALYKVRVMHTTTGVSYLIVVGNASGTTPQQMVYALPLVDKSNIIAKSTAWITDPNHGAVANKNIQAGTNLVTVYNNGSNPPLMQARAFQLLPQTTADLTTESDVFSKVGGGATIGAIQDIAVVKDTVYVSTIAGTNDVAGIFYSQILFDEYGACKGWTAWKRIASAVDATTNVYGLAFDGSQGRCSFLQGGSTTTVSTVITTTWSTAEGDTLLGGPSESQNNGLNSLLSAAFASTGKMLSLVDFPRNTIGFTTTIGQRTSLMLALGDSKLVLVESGQDNGDSYFIPRTGSFAGSDNKNFTNGTISSAPSSNTYMMTMSGGDLASLGSLACATIGKETTSGYGMYIIIGGTGGLAVLRAANGHGSADLQKSFNGLNGFSWVRLGTYSNIRSVQCDGQNLYVLTNTTFDRIPLSQLQGDTLSPFTLANPASLQFSSYGSFSDMVVSGNCALLATSNGLYTTGSGGVVATGTSVTDPLWQRFVFSEGPQSVTRLLPLSRTGFAYDVAKQTSGGQVEALASSVGTSLSSVYRLTIADATGGVTSTTVQNVPDILFYGIVGPYVNLGNYRNYYSTDGAFPLITRSLYIAQPALLQVLPIELGFRAPLTSAIAKHIVTIPYTQGPERVGPILRDSALGSLIVVTDNGLQILE